MGGVIPGILRSSVLCQFLNFNVSVQNEDALPDVLQMQFVSAQYEGANSGQNRSRNSRRIISCVYLFALLCKTSSFLSL